MNLRHLQTLIMLRRCWAMLFGISYRRVQIERKPETDRMAFHALSKAAGLTREINLLRRKAR